MEATAAVMTATCSMGISWPWAAGRAGTAFLCAAREVLDSVLLGRSIRTIAQLLCAGGKTIEFRRARIREKLGVGSLAELFGLFLPFASQVEAGESERNAC